MNDFDYSADLHSPVAAKRLIELPEMPVFAGLAICKNWAINRIKTEHAKALKLLSGDATTEDRDTWPDQREASIAHLSGTADEDQAEMLTDLLNVAEGETVDQLAMSIAGKAKAMKKLTGLAGGVKRNAMTAIETATSIPEIESAMLQARQKMQEATVAYMQRLEELKQASA